MSRFDKIRYTFWYHVYNAGLKTGALKMDKFDDGGIYVIQPRWFWQKRVTS